MMEPQLESNHSARRADLDGAWTLAFTHPVTGQHHRFAATVPGNVEVDLLQEGLIEDPYPTDNVDAMRAFDLVDDWTYETSFDAPDARPGELVRLVFDGIDTIADVILNGETVLRCENMLIPHSVDVTGRLKPTDNSLAVCIHSPVLHARRFEYNAFQVERGYRQESAFLRKARHMWGWDNAPRLLSAGIWRPVYLLVQPAVRFSDVYAYTKRITADTVSVGVNWSIVTPDDDLNAYTGRFVLSSDGEVAHDFSFDVDFTAGRLTYDLPRDSVRLWWPRGYGEPFLYDLSLQLLRDGAVLAEENTRFGIREIDLVRTEVTNADGDGEFVFVCNGQKVYVRGTNWKPKDALHSCAAAKVRRALDLCIDLNCNMVRIWGGGIYEDREFFDYCDETGLMVWQDFMFACEFPPEDEAFLGAVREEAETVVKRLRNHASLAVWCGDNEVDATFGWDTLIPKNLLPSDNRVTREVLRTAVLRHDPYRSYVPSSPYVSDEIVIARRRWPDVRPTVSAPESHMYPGNEQFREAYRTCPGHFLGETGPFFINSMSQTPEVVERDLPRARRLWDVPIAGKDYTLGRHQVDLHFLTWKDAARKRLRHMFGREFSPDAWEELALGINIICADMFKFAIEHSRCTRWRRTGVLWWSLMDMWPMMFNYSVVDSKFCPKEPPYTWIRQSQQTRCLMIQDVRGNGTRQLLGANDTLQAWSGRYRVWAVDGKGEEADLMSGTFAVDANQTAMLGEVGGVSEAALLVIEWDTEGELRRNHYVWGDPPFSFETYRDWCARLVELYSP